MTIMKCVDLNSPNESMYLNMYISQGAVVAQWIRPHTLNREVPGLNLLAAAVVP